MKTLSLRYLAAIPFLMPHLAWGEDLPKSLDDELSAAVIQSDFRSSSEGAYVDLQNSTHFQN